MLYYLLPFYINIIIMKWIQVSLKWYICNELGEVNAGWIPARPASVDQVHTKNNRHTPVMVYDNLIINKHSVVYYNINRSRPMTFL